MSKIFYFLCLTSVLCSVHADVKKPPHIITILADDLGWNDVGFHGSNQILTPNIDALAYNGIILNRHYVQPLCTPSRAAFLTGKYPIRLGMQHSVVLEPEPRGLPLNETLLPQHLKKIGYVTRAVGKWHLGFCKKVYTPTFRGFDSHYGYWNGFQDYYNQSVKATFVPTMIGYDMRRNLEIEHTEPDSYSTHLFTNEAVKLIKEHNTSKPLFLYLAHLAPHTGNIGRALQAPDDEIAKYSHIADPERRVYAAMVSILDRGIGEVISALRQKGMLDNSIILFMSDNGAPTFGVHANKGSNYPLKGQKNSPWEGGSRGVATIWSPLLKNLKRVSNQLIHITDWLPTFWGAIGRDSKELGNIDGINIWNALREDTPSPRKELVINIDPLTPYAAIIQNEWKIVNGSERPGYSWFGDSGMNADPYDPSKVLYSQASSAILGYITERQIVEQQTHPGNTTFAMEPLTEKDVISLRKDSIVTCSKTSAIDTPCNLTQSPCLFNILDDPCEMRNLAFEKIDLLKNMQALMEEYQASSLEPANLPMDLRADPARFNDIWENWLDIENGDVVDIFSTGSDVAIKVFFSLIGVFVFVGILIQINNSECVGGKQSKGYGRSCVFSACASNESETGKNLDDSQCVSVAQRVEMFEEKEQAKRGSKKM